MRGGRSGLAVAALGAALALVPAARAEVTLANAWLRPAAAGAEAALVYVDIRATDALDLVGARSPFARGAELVLVDPPDPDPTARRVVAKIPVAAGGETRLAYLGSHVRLTGVTRDLVPGMRVPVELTFADAQGNRRTATADALVRGIVPRRPADAREALPDAAARAGGTPLPTPDPTQPAR